MNPGTEGGASAAAAIPMLHAARAMIAGLVEPLSDAQLLAIPPGFRNNILWHLGHVIVTQQLLHYRLAGQPMAVGDEMVAAFRNGTSPEGWTSAPDRAELMRLLRTLPEPLADDYRSGRLSTFTPFTTSTGVEIRSIEDALAFNLFHEGAHAGMMLTMRKLVTAG